MLSERSEKEVQVHYSLVAGNATSGDDYEVVSNILVFTSGDVSQHFVVPIVNDLLDEPDETITVMLSEPTNATLGTPTSATLKIADDDDAPTTQFDRSTVSVEEGNTTVPITITLNQPSAKQVTLRYETGSGTATNVDDYIATTGVVTFSAGETVKSVLVSVGDDALDEEDETVIVSLSDPTNVSIGTPNTLIIVIEDNDALPTVQLSTGSLSIGEDSGTATVMVTLNQPSGRNVTVDISSFGGTALAGEDFTVASPTVTFMPGEISKPVGIFIIDDIVLQEEDESFTLSLNTATHAMIGTPSTTTITIVENDTHAPSTGVEAPTDAQIPVAATIVTPFGPVEMVFDDVQAGGVLTVLLSSELPGNLPTNYTPLGYYYTVTTSGIDFASATIQFPYREVDVVNASMQEESLRLLHWNGEVWLDITVDLDTALNFITGTTEHFSSFVLATQNLEDCSISLNAGAVFANDLNVTVSSDMPAATEMQIGNDSGLSGVQWQPYRSTLSWKLDDPGNQVITLLVYVRLRDGDGTHLCSGLSLLDNIGYDPLAPTINSIAVSPTSQDAGISPSNPYEVHDLVLLISAQDQQNGSGLADIQVSQSPNFAGARWQNYANELHLDAPFTPQTLYVRVRDGARNVSAAYTIVLGGNKPSRLFLPLVEDD